MNPGSSFASRFITDQMRQSLPTGAAVLFKINLVTHSFATWFYAHFVDSPQKVRPPSEWQEWTSLKSWTQSNVPKPTGSCMITSVATALTRVINGACQILRLAFLTLASVCF
jgi:hypothetical protein